MRLIHIPLIIACLIAAAAQAQVQDYPARPIRLVVPIGQDEIQRWSGLVARYSVSVD